MPLDKMDRAILAALAHDARMTWQAVGRRVHLTGQAVATRVQQMVDGGTIRGFIVARGDLRRYFITVFMDTPQFDAFEAFLQAHAEVESASKIAGEGCYQVTLACESARLRKNSGMPGRTNRPRPTSPMTGSHR